MMNECADFVDFILFLASFAKSAPPTFVRRVLRTASGFKRDCFFAKRVCTRPHGIESFTTDDQLTMSVSILLAAASGGSLTLKYFDARGAAETTRVLLAIGGIPYDDKRYAIGPGFDAPEFMADKESGALALNLNRAPLLVTEEGSIGQSKSMERYVAGKAGLMGSTPFEAAMIDMVAEHVRDIKDAQQRKGFSRMARGKTDKEKATLSAEWYGTDLPGWLARLEACVVQLSGVGATHTVGDRLSYADVCIWSLLREGSPEDVALVAKAAAGCSTLQCIAAAVAELPTVSEWVQSRPVTAF